VSAAAPVPGCPGCEALQARVQAQDARIAELEAALAALQAQVAELTARLQQDSHNSSKPPSSDPPWQSRPPRSGSGSGRKRGGQQGHPGRTRRMAAEEDLTASHDYFPAHCRGCGASLPETARAHDPAPRRHQVWDLPEAPPTVTEHRCHGRYCSGCGKLTFADLPVGVSPTGQGPRLEAFVVLLTGGYRVSRRGAAHLVQDVWRIPLCPATVSRIEARLSHALEPIVAALGRALAAATQVHVDETPWWEAGKRFWLWTAGAAHVVLYRIDPERSRDAFNRLLAQARAAAGEEFAFILGSDRLSTYGHWPAARHQHCLAHVQRDLEGAALRGGMGGANAAWAQEALAEVFSAWHRYRRGELDRAGLLEAVAPAQRSFRTALELGEMFGSAKQRGLFRTLLKEWERLWVFLEQEGVEPTNNRAERALRGGVIWRKTSFGSQSERGRQYVERVLTVVGTARLQGRNVLEYLTEVVRAAHAGRPAPDLLHASPP
jgi:transposase